MCERMQNMTPEQREQMRERMQNLTPEQREQMREMMQQRRAQGSADSAASTDASTDHNH
jgi:Spy/CpxP family protein refolding chaperone